VTATLSNRLPDGMRVHRPSSRGRSLHTAFGTANQLRVRWGRRTKGGAGAAAKGETTAEEVLAALQVQDVFGQEPYRVWAAHEADVLDLCWSATQVRQQRRRQAGPGRATRGLFARLRTFVAFG
jgi:hypothetical protein